MAEFTAWPTTSRFPAVIWTFNASARPLVCHAHVAGRRSLTAVLGHGEPSTSCCSMFARRVLHARARRIRSGRTIQTPVFVMFGSGSRNEQLDGRSVPFIQTSRSSAARYYQRRHGQARELARYKDIDGDGIGYRTLPGTDHPAAAYFAPAAVTTKRSITVNVPTTFRAAT